MNRIFEIEELNELEVFLKSQNDIDKLRDSLFAEFLKYADYKNVEEWNNAVRVCESLAIIGSFLLFVAHYNTLYIALFLISIPHSYNKLHHSTFLALANRKNFPLRNCRGSYLF